jgi:two-component system nitrogen regulation response regulator NtrX
MARLLVVDDEERFRIHLGHILEADGHEVRTAANDTGALEALEGFAPDLLIVDWMLRSSTDGLDLAEALRARHPELPIIVITGYPAGALHERVAAGEFAAVLEKPFLRSSLREVVERTLDSTSGSDR